MERTNARTLTASSLPEPISLASVDVSFISLRLVLAAIATTFDEGGGDLIPLVKPQFEAGRGETHDGVVRDPAIHARVLREVAEAAVGAGLEPVGAIPSPIRGPDGNREFLLHLRVPARSRRVAQAGSAAPLSAELAARLEAVAHVDAG
jgi:23S rRNA (cytidine1920-2'-O)/16S rRNA (cytidine1409-2'-O)-methyltransferase